MDVTIYGSKGSVPFFSRQSIHYGGNTTCVRIDYGNETLLLDGGSGILQYLEDKKEEIARGVSVRLEIVIGHLHMDHIIGLSSFFPLWNPNNDIRIYTKSRNSQPLAEQLLGLFSPPYWPVNLSEALCASIIEIDEREFCTRGGLRIQPFAAPHRDDTMAFRVTGDKTLVYLMDCEVDDKWLENKEFIGHCMNADMILFDNSYLPEDYRNKVGWGHSTYEHGLKLAAITHCENMIFSHNSQVYSDEMLHSVEEILAQHGSGYHLAYDGMEFSL